MWQADGDEKMCEDFVRKMNKMFDINGDGAVDRCENVQHCLTTGQTLENCVFEQSNERDITSLDEQLELCSYGRDEL